MFMCFVLNIHFVIWDNTMIDLDACFPECPNLYQVVRYENKEDVFLMHRITASCLTLLLWSTRV